MTKRIATLLVSAALAVGCCLPALADEAIPTPAPGPTSEATSSTADNTGGTVAGNNTSGIIPDKSAPLYYPYEIDTVPDGRQTLIVMRYRVPEGTTADALELDGLTRMGEPYTLWAVTETPEGATIEEKEAEQTFDVSVYSNIPEEARSELRETIDYSDEDGFAGTLTLADLTVSETAQEDGTYIATTRYTGTVSRSLAGDVCYELYYAPVNAPAEPEPVREIPTDVLLLIMLVSLAMFIFTCMLMILRRPVEPKARHSAEPKPKAAPPVPPKKQKIYVPANDIVVGGKGDDDENLV
ncbi:MAG TPA: hypothetical protein H9915_02010 [Candidatus Gemmiger faecigallinarum]|nr:hypothetical protein [Candidatus Gemmiger faecigallinarum]